MQRILRLERAVGTAHRFMFTLATLLAKPFPKGEAFLPMRPVLLVEFTVKRGENKHTKQGLIPCSGLGWCNKLLKSILHLHQLQITRFV